MGAVTWLGSLLGWVTTMVCGIVFILAIAGEEIGWFIAELVSGVHRWRPEDEILTIDHSRCQYAWHFDPGSQVPRLVMLHTGHPVTPAEQIRDLEVGRVTRRIS